MGFLHIPLAISTLREREVKHDDVLRGFDSSSRTSGRGGTVLGRLPVNDFEKLLAHHAVVLAGEVRALFDLRVRSASMRF